MISSQYLTHKHPAWQGCTLSELLTLAGGVLVIVIMLLGCVAMFFGKFSIIGMGAFPLTFIGMRLVAPRYAKSKHGKPHGYLVVIVRRELGKQLGGSPYESRTGYWSTERSLMK